MLTMTRSLSRSRREGQAVRTSRRQVRAGDPGFGEAYNNLAFTLRKQGSANFQAYADVINAKSKDVSIEGIIIVFWKVSHI